MIKNFSFSFTLLLALLDMVAILSATWLAEWLRITVDFGAEGQSETFATPGLVYMALLVLWILILNMVGAYSPRQTYRATLEILYQAQAVLLAIFVFSGFFFIAYRDFSRLQLAYLLIILLAINVSFRLLLRLYYRLQGGRKYDSQRVLIVGTGDLAVTIGLQVRSYAWTGLYLVGYVETDPPDANEQRNQELNIIGHYNTLTAIVKEHDIDEIIFAMRRPDYMSLLVSTKELYQNQEIRVRIAPDFQELAYLFMTVEDLQGWPLIGLRDYALTLPQRVIKRTVDIMVSMVLLVLAIPIIIVISIAIMLDSPGTPFFIQERMAQGKRTFKMIKFRTMVKNAEALQSSVNRYDDDGNLIHKSPDDMRVTRIGQFLRRTSLDEIPQFFNIIKGDMSLVGPRPELPWMLEHYEEWQMKRFEVPQGLTGWWQINGRSETPMHLSIEDDLFYIINYSLMLDIMILLRTPFVVFRGKGAF